MKRKQLKLTFVDHTGEPYHECLMGPREAKRHLAKQAWSKLYMNHVQYPFTCLSYAEVARQSRGAKVTFVGADCKEHTVLITLDIDN